MEHSFGVAFHSDLEIINCVMDCPKLISKYYRPRIVWYQTDVAVIIRILLLDVDKYFLQVECDHLLFSTTVNSKDYYICLSLFGTVVAEETTHLNLRREIRVTLVKAHKRSKWLRLLIEKEKDPLISYDLDHIDEPDQTMDFFKYIEKESFTEYKRRNNITHIMPDVPSSDEEESDDDITDMLFL